MFNRIHSINGDVEKCKKEKDEKVIILKSKGRRGCDGRDGRDGSTGPRGPTGPTGPIGQVSTLSPIIGDGSGGNPVTLQGVGSSCESWYWNNTSNAWGIYQNPGITQTTVGTGGIYATLQDAFNDGCYNVRVLGGPFTVEQPGFTLSSGSQFIFIFLDMNASLNINGQINWNNSAVSISGASPQRSFLTSFVPASNRTFVGYSSLIINDCVIVCSTGNDTALNSDEQFSTTLIYDCTVTVSADNSFISHTSGNSDIRTTLTDLNIFSFNGSYVVLNIQANIRIITVSDVFFTSTPGSFSIVNVAASDNVYFSNFYSTDNVYSLIINSDNNKYDNLVNMRSLTISSLNPTSNNTFTNISCIDFIIENTCTSSNFYGLTCDNFTNSTSQAINQCNFTDLVCNVDLTITLMRASKITGFKVFKDFLNFSARNSVFSDIILYSISLAEVFNFRSSTGCNFNNIVLADFGTISFYSLESCNFNNIYRSGLNANPGTFTVGSLQIVADCSFSNIALAGETMVLNLSNGCTFTNIKCGSLTITSSSTFNTMNSVAAAPIVVDGRSIVLSNVLVSFGDITVSNMDNVISNVVSTGNITVTNTGNIISGCRLTGTIDGSVGNEPLVVGCWAAVIGPNIQLNSIGNVP